MVSMTLVHISVILSLTSLEGSLQTYLPAGGCGVFWFASSIASCWMTTSGFAIALLRAIIIKWKVINREKAKQLALKLILMTGLMVAGLSTNIGIAKFLSGTALTYEFCEGRSAKMHEYIAEYEGASLENRRYGVIVVSITIASSQFIIFLELAIYLFLYHHQYKHNKTMQRNGIFSNEVIAQRHRKNVITLSGQTTTFVVEMIGTTIVQLLINVKSIEILEPASFPLCLIVVEAITAITHIWSSPELRRFYTI